MREENEFDLTAARDGHRANLERVSNNISQIVADFCRRRFREGRSEFRMTDLTSYVSARSAIAPDSAGRILRDLRKRKVVGYTVVNRAQSLYKLTEVSSA